MVLVGGAHGASGQSAAEEIPLNHTDIIDILFHRIQMNLFSWTQKPDIITILVASIY